MGAYPSAALQFQPPKSPLEQMKEVAQLKSLGDQQQLQQQAIQTGNVELQQKQQALKDQQAMTAAMQEWDGKDLNGLIPLTLKHGASANAVMGLKKNVLEQQKSYSDIAKNDAETGQKNIDTLKAKNDMTVGALKALDDVPDEQLGQHLQMTAQDLVNKGVLDPQHAQAAAQLAQLPPAQARQQLKLLEKSLMGNAAQLAQAKADQEAQAAAAALPGTQAKSQIEQQEAALSPTERALKGQNALEYFAAKGDPLAQQALQKKIEVAKASRAVINAPGSSPNDPKDIAAGIMAGDLPPTTKGLYRNAAPVLAELGRQGFSLQRAETDWNAVQKHIATLNGSQQERLRQSISSATDMLDKIDGLYSEWKQLAPTTGFKVINKATLAAMKNLPGRPGAVATALEAQIADLTADLGNVYMGGNSPTDHALGLAGKNLSADWNDQTFQEALKQAKANLQIRANSIRNSQPVGVTPGSQYIPPVVPQKAQPIYAVNPQTKQRIVSTDGGQTWQPAQ